MLKLVSASVSRAVSCATGFLLVVAILLSPSSAVHAVGVGYEYDDAGRLKRVVYPNSNQRAYKLDAAGNRTEVQVGVSVGGFLQFQQASYTISEAGGSIIVSVTRTGSTIGAVSVQYSTVNGTAIAGTDYTAASGTVTWSNGDSAPKLISIPILDDGQVEPAETLTLVLSAPTGGALIAASTGTITISDNDASTAVPAYRFRLGSNFLYTRTVEEMAPFPSWVYEGIAFYVYPTALDANTMALHHCYIGGTADHFLTSDASCYGHTYLAQLGYVSTIERPGTTLLYEFYYYAAGGHLTTVNVTEGWNAGYSQNGSNGYAYLSPETNSTGPLSGTAPVWNLWTNCVEPSSCVYDGHLAVQWRGVAGATRYEVEKSTYDYNTGLMGPFSQIYNGMSVTYMEYYDTRSPFGDRYRVRACNATACGPYTTVLSFYMNWF